VVPDVLKASPPAGWFRGCGPRKSAGAALPQV